MTTNVKYNTSLTFNKKNIINILSDIKKYYFIYKKINNLIIPIRYIIEEYDNILNNNNTDDIYIQEYINTNMNRYKSIRYILNSITNQIPKSPPQTTSVEIKPQQPKPSQPQQSQPNPQPSQQQTKTYQLPTERKNLFNETESKLLLDSNKKNIEEYLRNNNIDKNVKLELERRNNQIDEEDKINKQLDEDFKEDEITTIYQPNDINDIRKKQSNPDIINHENLSIEFNKLNTDIYLKLISIMLNPELFCNMFYENTTFGTNKVKYKYINDLLKCFFIKSA